MVSRTENNQKDEINRQFIKEIRWSIRKAFIKMGMIVGVAVLVIVLCAVFILPKAVSDFYYNPNEVVGKYEEMTTTRMDWIFLFILNCFCRVIIVVRSVRYREGMVNTILSFRQTFSWTGKFTSVSGRLVRGNLTFYDNNILSRPLMQFYLPGDTTAWEAWEVDENGKETKVDTEMRKEESVQDSKDAIAEYNDKRLVSCLCFHK